MATASPPGGERNGGQDPMPREITVFFDDLKPVDASVTGRPDFDTVESVLFVFDTVNTALGGRGQIWIDDVKYGR